MTRFIVAPDGGLSDASGGPVSFKVIEDRRLTVPHLTTHVLALTLPKGDTVKIKVDYSSHCWTRTYDPASHARKMQIMDGSRARAFCPHRYENSKTLGGLLAALHRQRIYLTPSDRNYAVYNATAILADGTAYTAFFTLKQDRGQFDGIRHRLRLYVESAYHAPQPSKGMRVKAAVIIGKALKGEKLKYR